ncbi:hypothetical protein K2173_003475 [Erythroxylum novogranatense]|uniref:Uncharacterized protein n=1 Tax=Erythroxylum novogranatense TaxID=1862640 RepID=A0AAV8S945_9ROSI|nr:hypothetical protein K2173_003475 [Erythroxylum novogranatense]
MEQLMGPRLYNCCNCRTINGRAFLFSHAMNVALGPKEDRCLLCDRREVLGWKYERVYEASQ